MYGKVMKKFRIIENPSELGAGTRGSSLGIDALRIAAINKGSQLFYENKVTTLKKNNKKLFKKVDTPHAIRIKSIYKRIKELGKSVSKSIDNGEIPLVISGDHSSAAGTIAGIKKSMPSKRLGIIWIDAHADLHTPYTTPSGNVHGMPLAMSLGINNEELQRNEVVDKTLDYWNKLKSLFEIENKINYEDLVFIGLRSTEEEEDHQIKKFGIKAIHTETVRKNGAENVVDDTLNYLNDCDALYISYDVDSMDPDSTSYGTGTPVKNGLVPDEVKDLITGLYKKSNKVKALEVCEINPLLDEKNKMAEITLSVLEEILKTLKSN